MLKGFHKELKEAVPGGVLVGSAPVARMVCRVLSGSSDLTANLTSRTWSLPVSL